MQRHLFAGVATTALLIGTFGVWAASTDLAGAVIAGGHLVVESSVKKVQHPTGGVVGELKVRDGDSVKAGDVLLRLDETQTRANLSIVSKALDELMARRARLETEREAKEQIDFPEELASRLHEPTVNHVVTGERALFDLRRTARTGQKAQLKERVTQLKDEIRGLDDQAASKLREIELIRRELEGVRELWSKNLTPITRLTALERENARLEGEHGRLVAESARAKGRIVEVELQIIQVDQDLRSEVATELAQVRARITELGERKVAAEDQLNRIDIRAPRDGIVHELTVHTIGGVIGPGETVMHIVPAADSLTVEARVAPDQIDRLYHGQPTVLRFSAFNQRTTPEVTGQISRISADLSQDQRTGAAYYLVRIAVPEPELARLGNLKLVPGMPVEAFIQTGERSVLSYLFKPLSDYAMRAFRDG